MMPLRSAFYFKFQSGNSLRSRPDLQTVLLDYRSKLNVRFLAFCPGIFVGQVFPRGALKQAAVAYGGLLASRAFRLYCLAGLPDILFPLYQTR